MKPPVLHFAAVAWRVARRVLRVSADLRRGAAPYADGCERFFGHSHPISLLHFECIIGFEGAILHNFLRTSLYHRAL